MSSKCTSPGYVREENAYVTENTYVGGRRRSAEYVRTSQHLRICTHGCRSPRMRTPNLHHHGRSWNTMSLLRRQTDLETFTKAAYNSTSWKRPSFRFRNAQAIVGHNGSNGNKCGYVTLDKQNRSSATQEVVPPLDRRRK